MARERWGSKLGIIMAVAGSAIGLGNFLRFPVQAAQNGGGAFMIPYFTAFFLLGLPLMWIEWAVGRLGGSMGHSTAPGMFHTLWPKNRLVKYLGAVGLFGPVIVFVYYIYVESWLLGYSVFALLGKYNSCTTHEAMSGFLRGYQGLAKNEHFSSLGPAVGFFLITFGLNMLVLYLGIRRGIERVCKYLLPVLGLFAVILMVKVLSLGAPDPSRPEHSVLNGFGFLWNPNWASLKEAKVWLAAAGQIFFTLSVGFGVILTYASYLTKKDDVALSGLTSAAANETAEVILGASIVIPAAFAFFGPLATAQIAQEGAFNLAFVTMPLVLQKVAFGDLFGFLWFALLFFAGVTSSISLAQPAIAFLQDEFRWPRLRAVSVFGIVTFVMCQACIFLIGKGVIDELDFWGGTFAIVVFATVETILFGWAFGIDKAWAEMHHGAAINVPRFYRWVIKYVTPTFLLTILFFWFLQKPVVRLIDRAGEVGLARPLEVLRLWGTDLAVLLWMKDRPVEGLPYVWGIRGGLLAFFVGLIVLIWLAWRRKRQVEVVA
ncbi:MAG: sodium:calcium symporter [Planctomycetes bacterium]|nr:sodium:calcium symporter [Planctomycetota bacterium]